MSAPSEPEAGAAGEAPAEDAGASATDKGASVADEIASAAGESAGADAANTDDAPSGDADEEAPLVLSRGQKIAFALVYVVIGLVLSEVAARVLSERPDPMFNAHPYLRHVRAKSVSHTFVSPITGKSFTVSSDEHGFRTKNLEPPGTPKPKGTYRIFFVGGSTTENIALPDEETFQELVQVRLNEKLGGKPTVRTINTGVSGNAIADSFSLIAHRILALEPDLIVVLHASNDMRQSLSDRFDPSHYDDRLQPKPIRIMDWARQNSRLLDLGLRLKKLAGSKSGPDRYRKRRKSRPFTKDVDPSRGLPYFKRYLAMISAVCKEAGVPLAFMTQPSLYKPDNSEEEDASFWLGVINHGEINVDNVTLLEGMKLFNDATAAFARERGHVLIDLDAVVPKDLEHFYDDAHYTAKGCDVIADEIVKVLSSKGELPR